MIVPSIRLVIRDTDEDGTLHVLSVPVEYVTYAERRAGAILVEPALRPDGQEELFTRVSQDNRRG